MKTREYFCKICGKDSNRVGNKKPFNCPHCGTSRTNLILIPEVENSDGTYKFTCVQCQSFVVDNEDYLCPHCYKDNSHLRINIKSEIIPPAPKPVVDKPAHYQIFNNGVQAIDLIKELLSSEEYQGYLKGNILKYRLRAGKKGDTLTDIAKADWYEKELKSL